MKLSKETNGYLPLFAKGSFMVMWLAQNLSNLGDGVARIALLILVTEKTKSPLALSLMAMAQALPVILFGPLSGVLIDRFSRKKLMVLADLSRAVLIALVITAPSLNMIYVLAFLIGLVGTVFNPARSAVMPEMAGSENYAAAVGMTQVGTQLMMILGPAIGGILVGYAGTAGAFAFDAVTFFVSGIVILCLRFPKQKPADPKSGLFVHMKEGAGFIWTERKLRFLFGLYLPVIFVLGSIGVLMVDYLRNTLEVSGQQLGLVQSALAGGLILATLAVGQYGGKWNHGRLITNSITSMGLVTMVYFLRPGYGSVVAWAGLVGLADGLSEVPIHTLLLKTVPDEMRGRVFAAVNAMARLGGILGLALAGPLAAMFGAHWVMACSGLVVALIGSMARFSRGYEGFCRGRSVLPVQ